MHIIREPETRAQYKPQHTYIVKVLRKDIAGWRVSQKPSKKKYSRLVQLSPQEMLFLLSKRYSGDVSRKSKTGKRINELNCYSETYTIVDIKCHLK